MNSLSQLERDALDRRAQFAKTLLEVRSHLTPSGLANETLGLINPQYGRLRSACSAVIHHPILAAGLLAGAGWLFKHALRANGGIKLGRASAGSLSSKSRKRHLPSKLNK